MTGRYASRQIGRARRSWHEAAVSRGVSNTETVPGAGRRPCVDGDLARAVTALMAREAAARVMRILVVEDERKVASFIRQGLAEEGHAVEVCHDGAAGLDLVVDGPPFDLVVLDLMLPRLDGFALLRAARDRAVDTPVLVLTARDSVADRVRGLDLGADDYLTKPFSFDEFLARVRALLRRRGGPREPVLRLADLVLDTATREVARAGRPITLTTREYALLEYFLRNRGRVLTRPMLAEHVWGVDFDVESNIIDVYVGYLRRKIEAPGQRPLLRTVRGAGYVMNTDDDA